MKPIETVSKEIYDCATTEAIKLVKIWSQRPPKSGMGKPVTEVRYEVRSEMAGSIVSRLPHTKLSSALAMFNFARKEVLKKAQARGVAK